MVQVELADVATFSLLIRCLRNKKYRKEIRLKNKDNVLEVWKKGLLELMMLTVTSLIISSNTKYLLISKIKAKKTIRLKNS